MPGLLGHKVLLVAWFAASAFGWNRAVSMHSRGDWKMTMSTIRRFAYGEWRCSYRYTPPGSAAKDKAPWLLVHPIGIGQASWFYERFMAAASNAFGVGAPEIFAPDLLGCGASDDWNPSERGLFIPLDYVRQCEELWRQEIGRPCVVVTQGGLAPVGVALAARATDTWDGARAVSRLVMCSPPIWREMAQGSSRDAVARNYDLWTSSLARVGYNVLRRRPFVKFFSDQFLFFREADETWLDNCCTEAQLPAKEWPVFAFNAGVVNARPLYDELISLVQPTLLLEGSTDGRKRRRDAYLESMRDCERFVVENTLNALPWEAPAKTANLIMTFALTDSATTHAATPTHNLQSY